ncbi:12163_t:CDS:10 [Ambispora gerdemannii]|uniref:12163_t:CDS:1 n=1 Tax=Ambispora gerdemannii TaxID=144530 RepID=A0A9N9FHC5_9GLOM|nr:12163_t:CDS:10 [Ambispora gerdemannii]
MEENSLRVQLDIGIYPNEGFARVDTRKQFEDEIETSYENLKKALNPQDQQLLFNQLINQFVKSKYIKPNSSENWSTTFEDDRRIEDTYVHHSVHPILRPFFPDTPGRTTNCSIRSFMFVVFDITRLGICSRAYNEFGVKGVSEENQKYFADWAPSARALRIVVRQRKGRHFCPVVTPKNKQEESSIVNIQENAASIILQVAKIKTESEDEIFTTGKKTKEIVDDFKPPSPKKSRARENSSAKTKNNSNSEPVKLRILHAFNQLKTDMIGGEKHQVIELDFRNQYSEKFVVNRPGECVKQGKDSSKYVFIGAANIPIRGIAKIAKKLEIEFAEAVTGFDFPEIVAIQEAVKRRKKALTRWQERAESEHELMHDDNEEEEEKQNKGKVKEVDDAIKVSSRRAL